MPCRMTNNNIVKQICAGAGRAAVCADLSGKQTIDFATNVYRAKSINGAADNGDLSGEDSKI